MPVNSFENYPMSWIPEKPDKSIPLYRSFASQLEEAILSGRLAPNTLLPPQRELADYLDVNLSTITKAYKICAQKGYIYASVGKGTYVSPNASLYQSIPKNEQKIQYNLAQIEPYHATDPYVEQALHTICSRPDFRSHLTYQTAESTKYYQSSAVTYLKSLQIPAVSEQILLASGSQNALTITLLACFKSGDRIAVDPYTYHHFKMLANFLRINLIPIENDFAGMLPDHLDSLCHTGNMKGIYLMPTCSNPTSVEMPLARRLALADVIRKYRLTVIEDDSFRFLASADAPSFLELLPSQTVYICSTSKSLCAGTRLAYLLCPNALKTSIQYAHTAVNMHLSSLDAQLISELINNGAYKDIQTKIKVLSQKNNDIYDHIFQEENPYCNPYSFFRWQKITSEPAVFFREMEQTGIHLMDSDCFNSGIADTQHYMRIVLSALPNTDLERTLEMIVHKNR